MKASRPVRRGAVGKGAGIISGYLVSRLPNTNAAESIATGIWEFLERPEREIVFIEHYRDRAFVGDKPLYKEQFDLVTFQPVKGGFAKPRWRRISKEEADRITGTSGATA